MPHSGQNFGILCPEAGPQPQFSQAERTAGFRAPQFGQNLPLFFAAWRVLGREFTVRTLICTVLSSVMIDLSVPFIPVYQNDRLLAALRLNGLPTEPPRPLADILPAIVSDKKRAGDRLTLVVPETIGHCRLLPLPLSEAMAFLARGEEARP